MERSPEPSPPRARRSSLNLTLPTAPRLSQMSGSSVVYLDDSFDLTAEQEHRKSSLQSFFVDDEVRLSSSIASDPVVVEPGAFLTASPVPPARKNLGMDALAASLATQELAEIHSLIKSKSDRIAGQERDLHRSSCALAEMMSIAKVQLRSEAEALLEASQRELRKQVAVQRRRLDHTLLKTQEECRKVGAWRKEVRSMKEAMATHNEETNRLTQRLNDAQRRCSALAEREKAHRQALDDERAKWEKERRRLVAQQEKLHREVEELREQRQKWEKSHQGETRQQHLCNLNAVARSVFSDGETSQKSEVRKQEMPSKSSSSDHYTQRGGVSSSPDYIIPMMGAWWNLDIMSEKSNYQSLWGYVFFLTQVMTTKTSNNLWELADCFIRKWSWQLLVEATRQGWLAAIEADPVIAMPELEHNALAWARARQQGAWRSMSDRSEQNRSLISPFQLTEWAPGADSERGPLGILRVYFAEILRADETAHPQHDHVFLEPIAAQRQVASTLWRSVRQQLLLTEDTVRNGTATNDELAEAGRILLAVAVLSLPVQTSDTESALRSLKRLCDVDEHCTILQNDLYDYLPVLLWLADGLQAMHRQDNTSKAHHGISELVASLLVALMRSHRVDSQDEISMLAMALLRCSPKSPLAEPLAKMYCRSITASDGHQKFVVPFESQLQTWLRKCYADAPTELADRLASHFSAAFRV